jgi:nickel-dependent lactate racemase
MVNVIPGADGQYLGAVAGDIVHAHAEGCRTAKRYFEVVCKEKAPLVVANVGGYPRDRELYQSMKALGNAAAVTEEGGTIIFLSHCGSGAGPEEWNSWVKEGNRNRIVRALSERFSFPGFVALKCLHLTSTYRVILVSGLDRETVAEFHMEPASSLEEAFDLIGKDLPRMRKALFLPYAGATSPVLQWGA